MNTVNSVFRSEEGRDKIRNYYNQILTFCPCKQEYVTTSYGKTFYMEAGDESKPVVILIHGSCSNSAAWLGDMPSLAENFHVYAVDLLGEPGNSDDNRLSFETKEYADWLNEFMDQLDIKEAALIGNSMGGWMALHFAIAYPHKTSALALLAASGIVEPPKAFVDQTSKVSEESSENEASDAIMGESGIPKEVLEFMQLIMENFIPVTGILPIATNEQLKQLKMPLLFAAGSGDTTMNVNEAESRIKEMIPHAETIILEGAHIIMSSAGMVIPFLQKNL